MLNYYQNYLTHLATNPNESYRNDVQAFSNNQWDNTTQMYNVLEESSIGSDLYNPIDIQVDYAIELSTGLKKSDDFKVFNFKDLKHDVEYGLFYKYNNLTWMTVNKSETGSVFQSITVRKCNNIARWVNPDTGAIIEQPCIIDYEIGASRPKQDKDIIVADNSMVVIIQGNEYTKKLKQNQRIIFNGRPWKLAGFNNSLQNDIGFGNNVTLYYYDFYLDTIQPSDDIANNIANKDEYEYSIEINQDIKEQLSGFTGELKANIKLNGEIVDRNIKWKSNNYAIVNNGQYKLNGVNGDIAKITAFIEGNPNIYAEVQIKIVDIISENFEIIINPDTIGVKQNQKAEFSVNLYKNGVLQADIVTADVYDVSQDYYTFSIFNNVCVLSCIKPSNIPLRIVFRSRNQIKTILVSLTSVF